MLLRRVVLSSLVVAAGLVALAGCNATVLPPAQNTNATDTSTLYALSGTSLTTASAYSINGPEVVSTALTPEFDFAFDIDSLGNAKFLPLGALVSLANDTLTQPGLELSTTAFDALQSAPPGGYETDSALVVAVNDVVVARSNALTCPDGTTNELYAKIQILAIDPVARSVQFQIVADQNCGYLGVAPGLPQQ